MHIFSLFFFLNLSLRELGSFCTFSLSLFQLSTRVYWSNSFSIHPSHSRVHLWTHTHSLHFTLHTRNPNTAINSHPPHTFMPSLFLPTPTTSRQANRIASSSTRMKANRSIDRRAVGRYYSRRIASPFTILVSLDFASPLSSLFLPFYLYFFFALSSLSLSIFNLSPLLSLAIQLVLCLDRFVSFGQTESTPFLKLIWLHRISSWPYWIAFCQPPNPYVNSSPLQSFVHCTVYVCHLSYIHTEFNRSTNLSFVAQTKSK